MGHPKQFRNEKFEAMFPPTLHYYFEKIFESARGTRPRELGAHHVTLISKVVEKFKAALAQRQIAKAIIEHQLEQIEYPLNQLTEYFSQEGNGRLNKRDAEIFTSFVEYELSKLREMAVELDEEYSAQPT